MNVSKYKHQQTSESDKSARHAPATRSSIFPQDRHRANGSSYKD